jgi:hypothetical protein
MLKEAYYADYYPKAFQDFIKKWRGRKNEESLYVQFTSHHGDVLDKKAYENPQHSDPMGIYGYPLKYVIDYPADIWYGHGAKYLRVLEDKSRSPLYINHIGGSEAKSILFSAGLSSSLYDFIYKKFPNKRKGITSAGKILLTAIQIDIEKSKFKNRPYEEQELVTRSAKEQTQLFLKAGYDTIIDDSKTLKQAVINDREPQQIIFLRPTSFKVLDIFRMSDSTHISTVPDMDKLRDKIAGKIIQHLNDGIVDTQTSSLQGWKYYWTKEGRLIKILDNDTSISSRMNNLKMGQKYYKKYRKSDPHEMKIEILSEKEPINLYYFEDSKLDDVLGNFVYKWKNTKENTEKTFYSQEQFKKEKEEASRRFYEAQRQQEIQEIEKDWKNVEQKYNYLMGLIGLPELPKKLTGDEKHILDGQYGLFDMVVKGVDLNTIIKIIEFRSSPNLLPIIKNLITVKEKYNQYISNYTKTLSFMVRDIQEGIEENNKESTSESGSSISTTG